MPKIKKLPDGVMWRGPGVLSPRGLYLECLATGSEQLLHRLRESPRGSRLVMVTARLERVTSRQVCKIMEEVELGITSPPRSRKGRSS
jgi:hypothetical protein